MKFSSRALVVTLSLWTGNAFVAPRGFPSRTSRQIIGTSLSSVVEPSATEQNRTGRSKDEINLELSSGKLLGGGEVIDFSSVKGESRAEAALAKARESVHVAREGAANGAPQITESTQILGINDEVIDEVGHDLGLFADGETVQECASYLRSMAPNGFFESTGKTDSKTLFTAEEEEKYQGILQRAYVESGEVTSAFAKTFYMGTQILPEDSREAIWAIYVWCRRTDEIVDAPREDDEEMLTDLSSWEIRLENLWKHGSVEDVFDLPLLDVRIKYPNLEIVPFVDMVRGMLMDVPELGQDRYDTFDELHLYCYRVAGTVGLMCMPVFGCAPGYNEDIARYVRCFLFNYCLWRF